MKLRLIILLHIGITLLFVTCKPTAKTVLTSYGDGSYIFDLADTTLVLTKNHNSSFDSTFLSKDEALQTQFVCEFDSISSPSLTFELNSDSLIENDAFLLPKKLLALSDIEGNFEAYYKLLLSNEVIDSSYNWTFGKGHLVIVGDLVDRGDYVTQCLWLTYHLENEAKKHGGDVHYLVGNHEQLVLLGYDNYVSEKYLSLYKVLKTDVSKIYSNRSYLTHWISNKNAMCKIGERLFVLGGINPKILKYNVDISQVNAEIRRDFCTNEFKTDTANFLLTNEGILWYRGLVVDNQKHKKIEEPQLDSILTHFQCKSVVVGHSMVDQISKDFNGRVIRIDVDHYENSSALLIEDGIDYITDNKGDKRQINP